MAITRATTSASTKPNLYDVSAFDATQDYTFQFTYQGPQVHYNKLIIRDNETAEIVYEQQIYMMALKHTVPANTLDNNQTYYAVVIVYDESGNPSSPSDKLWFTCYTQPSLTITNLYPLATITNASYELQFEYSQPEGELLDRYQVIVYDSLGVIIAESATQYPNMMSGSTFQAFTYMLTSLNSGASYSVQIVGETVNHLIVDTGKIVFSVNYTNPAIFAILDLENREREGQIKIQSNIISVEGHSYPAPPSYIDNTSVDLRGSDDGGQHRVWFDEGFSLRRDFTLQMIVREPQDYSTLIEFSDSPIVLKLKYMKGVFASQGAQEVAYVSLRVYNHLTSYYLQSNYFQLLDDTMPYLHIWLRCVHDVYELVAEPISTLKDA